MSTEDDKEEKFEYISDDESPRSAASAASDSESDERLPRKEVLLKDTKKNPGKSRKPNGAGSKGKKARKGKRKHLVREFSESFKREHFGVRLILTVC